MTTVEELPGPSDLFVPSAWTDSSAAFVVGFDGSPASRAAARYGAIEARACGARLTLVMVLDRLEGVPTQASRQVDACRWSNVIADRDELVRLDPDLDVRVDVQIGDAAERLAARSSGQAALVLGQDIGLGSTTRNALSRCDVPVVVVPAGWRLSRTPDPRPILLGVGTDPEDATSNAARAFARDRAERYGVPLRVVTSIGSGPDDTAALLQSVGAQLIVLGRSAQKAPRQSGSVIDTVLRVAGVPVAVVPGLPRRPRSSSWM